MEIVIVRHWHGGVQACMEIVECAALVRWCPGVSGDSGLCVQACMEIVDCAALVRCCPGVHGDSGLSAIGRVVSRSTVR